MSLCVLKARSASSLGIYPQDEVPRHNVRPEGTECLLKLPLQGAACGLHSVNLGMNPQANGAASLQDAQLSKNAKRSMLLPVQKHGSDMLMNHDQGNALGGYELINMPALKGRNLFFNT